MTEPCDLSAVEARRRIGRRQLSPVELLESCLARIAAADPPLNAIVASDAERAREAARAAEAAVMRGEALGPLHGLPAGIKDLNATKGLRTTWGSPLFADHVPDADDAAVAAIRAAGAVILAKTNTPEFGAGANTTNRVHGATGNPFDPDKTCGGSSGGSAVALAAGMLPLANGSDYGGSLRTPAAFCGIAGFRPSPGRLPGPPRAAALLPFSVQGPMGRDMADLCLLLRAQLGVDRRDPFGVPSLDPPPPDPADLGVLRVAASPDLGCAPVDREIREVFAERLARIEEVFGRVDAGHPDFTDVHTVFEVTRAVNFAAAHADKVARAPDHVGPNVSANVAAVRDFGAADVADALAKQGALARRVHAFLDNHDVLLCPAAAVSPFPHDELYPARVDGETMPGYMRWLTLTYAPTMALCSAAVLPCGLDRRGLPFGLQIVGPRGADSRVLAVARALEPVLASDAETARPVPDLTKLTGRPR
jgi:Asp-tRNA(Asn)/Glu-tRNA(Gln) amidotransferase A subunit family amidase